MNQYNVVFVGFPVWWYRETSIIDIFMEEYDFAGKRFPNSVSANELKRWASEWI